MTARRMAVVLIGVLMLSAVTAAQNRGKTKAQGKVVDEQGQPVGDGDGHTLRGRLVVRDDRPAGGSNHEMILEDPPEMKRGAKPPSKVAGEDKDTVLTA